MRNFLKVYVYTYNEKVVKSERLKKSLFVFSVAAKSPSLTVLQSGRRHCRYRWYAYDCMHIIIPQSHQQSLQPILYPADSDSDDDDGAAVAEAGHCSGKYRCLRPVNWCVYHRRHYRRRIYAYFPN